MDQTPISEDITVVPAGADQEKKKNNNIAERLKAVSVKRDSAKAELQLSKQALDGFDNEALALLPDAELSKVVDSRIANGRTKARTDSTIRLIRAGALAVASLATVFGFNKIRDSLKPSSTQAPVVAEPPRDMAEKRNALPPKNDTSTAKKARAP